MSKNNKSNNWIAFNSPADLEDQACGRPVPGAGEAGHGSGQAQATPASNTGGRKEGSEAEKPVSEIYEHIVMVNGKAKSLPLRRGVGTAAFIDTLSFTVAESVFLRPDQLGTEEELAQSISADLAEIMGYGLSHQKNGMNGYSISWQMGSENVNYGYVAFGGKNQKETVLVHFTGHGLIAALDGWERRLYEWMQHKSEIEQCRKEMQSLIEQDQELNRQHELLQTIEGVGQITATWLLSVLVDIDKFPSSRKLISYLGLSPMVKDSGTSVKMTKVSKMGDKFVRKAPYIPARVVCLRSKLWRPWFEQKIKQGKHPKQIYILMMCKIIKYAYAVLKSGQPFDRERHRKAA